MQAITFLLEAVASFFCTLFLLRFFRLIVPTKINLQAESCAAVSIAIIEPFFGVSFAP